MSMLKQNTIKKRLVDYEALLKPEKDLKFEAKDNKEYKVKTIIDNIIYG